MAEETIELSWTDLREVAGFAASCARSALEVFERERPADRRPRAAIEAAQDFAEGAERSKVLRDTAWSVQRAPQEARDAGLAAASDAARAATAAAGAAFLHPLPQAAQVRHVLGSAARAARVRELASGDDVSGTAHLDDLRALANTTVIDVLHRYPTAPAAGGRVGHPLRQLDEALR